MSQNDAPGDTQNALVPYRFVLILFATVVVFIGVFIVSSHFLGVNVNGIKITSISFTDLLILLLAVFGTLAQTAQTILQMLSTINPSPPKKRSKDVKHPRRNLALSFITVIVAGVVVGYVLLHNLPVSAASTKTMPVTPNSCTSIVSNDFAVQFAGNECIGVSTGETFFDVSLIGRPSGYLTTKRQVLGKLKSGDVEGAHNLYDMTKVTNDAEMLIYFEDQRIAASHKPFVSFVVATILTGSYAQLGIDALQGAYVAQHEFNENCRLNGCTQIRLLIANSGTGAGSGDRTINTTFVSNEIAANADKYAIKGIMGWPFSGQTVSVLPILASSHIPLVSPSASSDDLTGQQYFWRVIPPNAEEANSSVDYALQTLHTKKVAVFYDKTDSYSNTLGKSFIAKFEANTKTNVVQEPYTINQTNDETMKSLLTDALTKEPDLDLIYFTGYGPDATPLMNQLPPKSQYPKLRIMGGDALGITTSFIGGHIPSNVYGRYYYPVFAYPNDWKFLQLPEPAFFCEYSLDFDPQDACPGPVAETIDHYNRSDAESIEAYDSMLVLLNGSIIAMNGGNASFTSDNLENAIATLHGSQGISGQINLGGDGNPTNKALNILSVNDVGGITLDGVQGCFVKDTCPGNT